jgi:hypothetical protein
MPSGSLGETTSENSGELEYRPAGPESTAKPAERCGFAVTALRASLAIPDDSGSRGRCSPTDALRRRSVGERYLIGGKHRVSVPDSTNDQSGIRTCPDSTTAISRLATGARASRIPACLPQHSHAYWQARDRPPEVAGPCQRTRTRSLRQSPGAISRRASPSAPAPVPTRLLRPRLRTTAGAAPALAARPILHSPVTPQGLPQLKRCAKK